MQKKQRTITVNHLSVETMIIQGQPLQGVTTQKQVLKISALGAAQPHFLHELTTFEYVTRDGGATVRVRDARIMAVKYLTAKQMHDLGLPDEGPGVVEYLAVDGTYEYEYDKQAQRLTILAE